MNEASQPAALSEAERKIMEKFNIEEHYQRPLIEFVLTGKVSTQAGQDMLDEINKAGNDRLEGALDAIISSLDKTPPLPPLVKVSDVVMQMLEKHEVPERFHRSFAEFIQTGKASGKTGDEFMRKLEESPAMQGAVDAVIDYQAEIFRKIRDLMRNPTGHDRSSTIGR